MTNIGIGVKNSRKFDIYNPSNQDYTYKWLNEDEFNPKKESDFRCIVTAGTIRSGKKVQVGFEFVSSEQTLVESFWKFVIPELNIVIPFLVVGNTLDPGVSLDRSHLNFKSLLIGHEAVESVSILNDEPVPLQFSFVESSCHAPGHSSALSVHPSSGTVPAKSSFPVDIHFTPQSDQEVNFNLMCNIKRKQTPLQLNVKAEGHSMEVILYCEDSSGNRVELSSRAINKINFGEVEINEKAIRNIYVVNAGKYNFDYEWDLQERSVSGRGAMVDMSPRSGGVSSGERELCQLSFCPPKASSIRGCELILRVSNGPTYTMQVAGVGIMPGLHMSFQSHNFGPCFIHRAGMPVHTHELKLTNTDDHDISVDCLYTSNQVLHHNFEAQVIAPKQSVNVVLSFYPREACKYHVTLPFEINGLSKQSVEIYGLGTEMKIEVADPKMKVVKFGALRVGQTVKKIIPIINNSPASITFHLGITPSTLALQDTATLKLAPLTEVTLAPKGGTSKVEMVFSPKCRIPQFAEEVLLEFAGLFQPLFVITGSCQGTEIQMDVASIPFGAVVQKSSSVRKLIMSNTGDIGARFKWELKKFAPDFSITPAEGYLSPGMDVPFDVTFHPVDISNDIRYDNLKCNIEGSKALRLTLTGMCVSVPTSKEVVSFSTHVRHKDIKNIQIMNKTNQMWHLRPIIDGEFWTGADTFDVEPQTTKPYELTYHPLTMTSEGKKHSGSVFFPLPDGTGLLYNVLGTSEPPRAISKNTRDVPCKTPFVELLSVNNWLKKPQRFRIKTECMRPDKLDPGTTVKGLDYIDIPGNAKRDYKLNFYAHKEGQSLIKVIFLNEQTGEYQFYEITFRAVRPGVISSIDLVTPVRQSVPHTLTLENPLSYPVTFAASCNVSEILMPNQLSVPANSEGAFNFEYLPLRVGEAQGRLEFVCNDLGLYMFDLNLKATLGGPERALYFRTGLGSSQTQVAKFLNFAKQRTEYACKIDCGDFHVDKTVAAAPGSSAGTEVAVEVTYEPSRIGESRGVLSVTSASGGDYSFPLSGSSIAPKPQGPFMVKAGSTTSITFRNVFAHTTAFVFQVDNPLFHVSKPSENIRSRKDHRIVVGFDGNDSSSKAFVMGKLTVSCAKSAGGATNAQWVYYLKGITPER
ncbi:hypothetical protein CAPTEDRAFT_222082 [Capitella teleta]|uniref:HYDIN/VesB/CFA65-like Ig-like domain-containing protein n=1 Tax=Capitella teleta TaxID=283909 RepID=R7TDL7_CAPTE|nr:hypothetical protein CAPTEDRAFT_222082 [Capitella teleta]|eukprot:ELT89592.1 hypothetical protein CAPTEDRAFT_222082 [Capitella teleta]